METEYRRKARQVLGAAIGICFLGGLLYIWSVISKSLMTEFHWTSSQASLPYTAAMMSFVVGMIVLGKLQDTKGPRICATLGGFFTGSGLFLSGLTTNPLIMVITFGVITGAGIGTTAIATTPPALKWFSPEKKGLISGIVLGSVALSAVFYSPLINYLLGEFGISATFMILGVGLGTVMILLAQFLTNPPAGYSAVGMGSSGSSGAIPGHRGQNLNWKDLIKRSDFYKLWLMFAFSSTAGLMVYGHATNIARIQAHWEGGYLLVIFLACFNLLGRLAGGTVSDIIGRINVMRAVLALQVVNMLVFSNYTTIPLLCVGVAVAGVCYGAAFAVVAAALADFYGLKYYGANYGLIYTAWGVGGIIGPMTAASILDATHSYNFSYFVACGLVFIALLIAISFKTSPAETGEALDNV